MIPRLIFGWVLAAGLACAQRGGMGGGDMGGGMGGNGMGGRDSMGGNIPQAPRVSSRIDMLATTLNLDKDQKKTVKNILDEAQKEANPVHEQIMKSRLAVGEAIQDAKPQEEVTKLITAEAALESQMANIELGAFVKVYKSLQQEQRNQTRTLFQMMKGMFDNKNWNNM
jgi:hypothetical protein